GARRGARGGVRRGINRALTRHRARAESSRSHQRSPRRASQPRRRRMGSMTEPSAAETAHPARTDLPFRLPALAWVITGGLTAAVTGPLGLEHGSWSAAFQVLVGGVMQGMLGVAQHRLAPRPPSQSMLLAQLLTWNLGSLAVIGGTVAAAPLLVDAGG